MDEIIEKGIIIPTNLSSNIPIWKTTEFLTNQSSRDLKSWPPRTGHYFPPGLDSKYYQNTDLSITNIGSNSSTNGTNVDKKHHKYKISQIRCINCGKIGHLYRNCSSAVTSFGVLVVTKYQKNSKLQPGCQAHLSPSYICEKHTENMNAMTPVQENDLLYLMVQRKDTMGFIDFVRGKYPDIDCPRKDFLIQTYVSEMTCNERKKLVELDFDTIWDILWCHHENRIYIKQKEYKDAKKKLESIDLKLMFETSQCNWAIQEWGFPKGRKNISESNVECAIREFCEETGYSKNDITLVDSMAPIVEEFQGTNGLSYKHIWYIAIAKTNIDTPTVDPLDSQQAGEVSDVGWYTREQCVQLFRSYEQSKIRVLDKVVHRYGHILRNLV